MSVLSIGPLHVFRVSLTTGASKHLCLFFFKSQWNLYFSSGLKPFVQFITIDKKMFALFDYRNAPMLDLIIK